VRRRRILVLAPFPPRGQGRHGGSRSIAQRLRVMARHHDVSLLYLHSPTDPPLDHELVETCVQVVAVDRSSTEGTVAIAQGAVTLPRVLWRTWRGTPLWVQAFRSSAVEQAVGALIEQTRPEIIQVEYQVMAQFLPAAPTAPVVLVIHEPAARVAENFALTRTGAARLLNHADRRAWFQFERRATDAAGRVVVFTEQDAAVLRAERPPVVVPIVVPLPEHPLDPVGEEPPSLLFVGNFGHPPNVDAVGWLVREIFPRVRRAHPSARLEVVGENPPAELCADKPAGVEFAGGVPDVEPWLDRAAVFVVPARLGGGMRVKTVEALAAGKAIVSTLRGIAGLDLAGDEVVIAETAEEFAEEVAALLAAPERRRELARKARHWAERTLAGDGETRAYQEIYAELAASES
jgi:polysaccharide biosynthesis protein PslH